MVIKFLEQFVLDRAGARAARASTTPRTGSSTTGSSTRRETRPGEGADDLRPDPGAPRRAACRRGPSQAAEQARQALRAPARELGREPAAARGRAGCASAASADGVLLSVIDPDDLRKTLAEFFDEAAFLSPHGLRAVSKRYEGNPYTLDGVPGAWIDYEPAESTTSHVRRQLELARADLDAAQLPRDPPVRRSTSTSSATTSSSSTRPARAASAPSARSRRTSPTGSSRSGCRGPDGRRPLYGGTERLQTDPAWKDNLLFNEYFHGDNGAGLGATHQTGWTALVADLILDPPSSGATLARTVPRV